MNTVMTYKEHEHASSTDSYTDSYSALEMTKLLPLAGELSDLINQSVEVATYLQYKQLVESDPTVEELLKVFARKKELFDECQRFGHFHPDYHAALDEVYKVQEQLDNIQVVRQFKAAEEQLDDLLYEVSSVIANAVSPTIKVPSNKLQDDQGGSCNCTSGGGGCSSGGCG